MKNKFAVAALAGLMLCAGIPLAQAAAPNLAAKEMVVRRAMTDEATGCIECHAKETPGIIEDWKLGKMGHAGISCIDCHRVEKTSPMASQCKGTKGTDIYISPMVSSKTCERCHPEEVKQFLASAHADRSRDAVYKKEKAGGKLVALQLTHEGGAFWGLRSSNAERPMVTPFPLASFVKTGALS